MAFKIDEPPSSFCFFHFIHSFIQMIFIRWHVHTILGTKNMTVHKKMKSVPPWSSYYMVGEGK